MSRKARWTLVRYSIPADYADAFGVGHQEIEGIAEMKLQAKGFAGDTLKQRLLDAVGSGNASLNDVIELPANGFMPEKVKFQMEFGGKTRTLSFSNVLHSMRGEFDVTEQMDWSGGHPKFKSVDNAAREILGSIEAELYKEAD